MHLRTKQAVQMGNRSLGDERRFARRRSGKGESMLSSSRVNMKLVSTYQLS